MQVDRNFSALHLRSAFETVQSTWFPFAFAFDSDFSLPLAFFTLFGQFLPYGDGFGVDDVFALFAKVSRDVFISKRKVSHTFVSNGK